ncbi:hypothetical protein Tco_0615871 [Tanacetum coccineum]
MTKSAGNVNFPTGTKTSLAISTGVQISRTRNGVNAEKEGTEDAVSTDKEKVSTDRSKDSTDKEKDSTDKEKEGTDKEKDSVVSLDEDDETIAQRPRPTSTRSLLTLKPLLKIDPKDKGKMKIEEEDESDTESEDIPEAEKKFKQLARDEYDFIQARIEADRLLALRLQDEERERERERERAVHYGRMSKVPS